MIKPGNKTGKMFLVFVVLVGTAFIISFSACAASPEADGSLPAYSAEKGNPKLDSQLNRLVQAETNDDIISFAQESGIEVADGRVRVIIECREGRLEEASEATEKAGAEIETSYNNLLQVLVSVNILNELAGEGSIRLISLPQQPLPASD
ncbi:hypothetical protein ACFLUG_01735 [Chloroflexota bacterium]